MSAATRVGLLGVGNMGQPMAERLLGLPGIELWVHDLRPAAMQRLVELGARSAASPRELADQCDTVVVSLPTLESFRNAMSGADGALHGSALRTLVNTCTVGAPFVTEMAQAASARDIVLIDCPVSGGPAGAAAGTLVLMLSGDPARIDALQPVLQRWSTTQVIAGDQPGAGQVLKLTNNILFAVSMIAASEAVAMGARAGVQPADLLQAINHGTGRSYVTASVFPQTITPEGFAFGATLDTLMKDVQLAIEQGEALGVPMWVCQAARLVLKHHIDAGHGSDDLASALRIVTRQASTAAAARQ